MSGEGHSQGIEEWLQNSGMGGNELGDVFSYSATTGVLTYTLLMVKWTYAQRKKVHNPTQFLSVEKIISELRVEGQFHMVGK